MKKLSGFMLVILMLTNLESQILINSQYPYLYKIKSHCSIIKTGDYYYYTFNFKNENNNKGSIQRIKLDISKQQNGISFDTIGLQFKSEFEKSSFKRRYNSWNGKIIPVSMILYPSDYWLGGINFNSQFSWSTDTLPILPGDATGNFVIMSKGLPGIRIIEFDPDFELAYYFLPIEDEDMDNIQDPKYVDLDSISKLISYKGLTVGPIAPPLNIIPLNWIDTLIFYTQRSRNLEWIDSDGVLNSLKQKLENAKQQLQKRNINSAKNILQAFINEVEAQKDKHLTSEAYALLKYNAEYLIEKLVAKK